MAEAWAQEITDFSEQQQSDARQLQALNDQQEALEDDSDDDLQALRSFQEMMDRGNDRVDGLALEALMEGGDRPPLAVEDEAEEAQEAPEEPEAVEDVEETALVPHEEALRGQQRAKRWFSHLAMAAIEMLFLEAKTSSPGLPNGSRGSFERWTRTRLRVYLTDLDLVFVCFCRLPSNLKALKVG